MTGERDNQGSPLWYCKCDCGNEVKKATRKLNDAKTTFCCHSCGMKRGRGKEAKIQKDSVFTYLTVVERCEDAEINDGRNGTKHYRTQYLCRCKCGNEVKVKGKDLLSGNKKSCGCLIGKTRFSEDKEWAIYIHSFGNECYVGQFSYPKGATIEMILAKYANDRWRNGNAYKRENHRGFGERIEEIGWEHFIHRIIKWGISTKQEADEEERLYIEATENMGMYNYNSYGSEKGVEGKKEHKSYERTEEARKKQSERQKEEMKANPQKWENARLKASQTTKERGTLKGSNNGQAKRVRQYTKDWKFVKEWEFITDACRSFGSETVSNISRVCNSHNGTAFGYRWLWADDTEIATRREEQTAIEEVTNK